MRPRLVAALFQLLLNVRATVALHLHLEKRKRFFQVFNVCLVVVNYTLDKVHCSDLNNSANLATHRQINILNLNRYCMVVMYNLTKVTGLNVRLMDIM